MRRRPPSNNNGGYNNQHRKPRYQGGGGGGGDRGQSHHSPNRGARRNYPAAREKYLAQARDAMASGDRVLAENYLQHADHCYRMMMEEGFKPRDAQQNGEAQQNGDAQPQGEMSHDEAMPQHTNALPSFISQPPAQVDPNVVQNWEERDA